MVEITNPQEKNSLNLVNGFISQAVHEGATDLHFELINDNAGSWLNVRFRVNGRLKDAAKVNQSQVDCDLNTVINAIKVASELDTTKRNLFQDGRFRTKVDSFDLDIRVSTIFTVNGERAALRIIDHSKYNLKIDELGMDYRSLETYKAIINAPQGFVIICGPVGCGKTTTLYSTLRHISTREKNIFTIEDPVELILNGINQIQVKPEFGLDFAAGLRTILRQDSNIVLVGEIRDLDTAKIAIRSALAGCLIFSTLHTKSTHESVTRLVEMGVAPYFVAATLNGIVSQRLVRLCCKICKGSGCAYCYNTGYSNRIGIFEVMKISKGIKDLILNKAPASSIKEFAVKEGMVTFQETAAKLIQDGLTTKEEIGAVLELGD